MRQKAIFTVLIILVTITVRAQNKISNPLAGSKMNNLYKNVEFESEGATLRGRLYLPEKASGKLPILIMTHGYSATIEGMVADRYAEGFLKAGFAVLLYDHRNFGISDGQPRQQINRWTQARGYRDAIDFVVTLPEIDSSKIGLWGDSMSGGEAMLVAAIDHRVKAVVAQVPACGSQPPSPDPDGRLFKMIADTFLHGNISGTASTTVGPMPVVSFDQETVPSMLTPLTAFRWFMEYGGRYNTKWVNRVSYVNPDVPVKFNPVISAPYIKAALLMVVAYEDEMEGANSDVARMAFRAAAGPKQLLEVDGGHFGILYYPSPLFHQVSLAEIEFIKKYLE